MKPTMIAVALALFAVACARGPSEPPVSDTSSAATRPDSVPVGTTETTGASVSTGSTGAASAPGDVDVPSAGPSHGPAGYMSADPGLNGGMSIDPSLPGLRDPNGVHGVLPLDAPSGRALSEDRAGSEPAAAPPPPRTTTKKAGHGAKGKAKPAPQPAPELQDRR
jgi:hypothetical protein